MVHAVPRGQRADPGAPRDHPRRQGTAENIKFVGWSMATTLHMQVVLDALNMALWQRRPSGVIHHSDHWLERSEPVSRPAGYGRDVDRGDRDEPIELACRRHCSWC